MTLSGQAWSGGINSLSAVLRGVPNLSYSFVGIIRTFSRLWLLEGTFPYLQTLRLGTLFASDRFLLVPTISNVYCLGFSPLGFRLEFSMECVRSSAQGHRVWKKPSIFLRRTFTLPQGFPGLEQLIFSTSLRLQKISSLIPTSPLFVSTSLSMICFLTRTMSSGL